MKADLSEMTVPELKELAKIAGIPKYAGMNKSELVAALDKPIESSKDVEPEKEKSSPKESDLENHPKFAKFKTGGKPL